MMLERQSNMSNQRAIVQLVKDVSGQSNVLAVPRIFIRMTGDIKAALFLSQCVYWSDKTKRDDGYFYKTAHEWEEETGLTRHELDNARKKTAQFVKTKLIKANGIPTLHYYADINTITEWIEVYYTEQENGFAEKRQTILPKSDKPKCRKATNHIAEKRQTILPKSDKPLTEITQENTSENTDIVVVVPQATPNIYGVYESEVGPLTPLLAQMLDDIDSEYPQGWFEAAVREAKRCTTRVSLKYIESILKRWKAEGLTPLQKSKEGNQKFTGTIEIPMIGEVET